MAYGMTNRKLIEVIEKIRDINIEELDIWLSIIPGCDINGLRTGQYALTKENQKVMILGFSDSWRPETALGSIKDSDFKNINISMTTKTA